MKLAKKTEATPLRNKDISFTPHEVAEMCSALEAYSHRAGTDVHGILNKLVNLTRIYGMKQITGEFRMVGSDECGRGTI